MARLTRGGAALRFFFALMLVVLTYNPSGYSYFHWLKSVVLDFKTFTPYVALAGVLILIGWVIYVRATLRSLGTIGITLVFLASASIMWLLFYWGWLNIEAKRTLVYVIQLFVSIGLAVGMCWSHVRRILSGQVDSDDVGEGGH